jgi:hypothetical protein
MKDGRAAVPAMNGALGEMRRSGYEALVRMLQIVCGVLARMTEIESDARNVIQWELKRGIDWCGVSPRTEAERMWRKLKVVARNGRSERARIAAVIIGVRQAPRKIVINVQMSLGNLEVKKQKKAGPLNLCLLEWKKRLKRLPPLMWP